MNLLLKEVMRRCAETHYLNDSFWRRTLLRGAPMNHRCRMDLIMRSHHRHTFGSGAIYLQLS